MRAVLEIFRFCFQFLLKQKGTITENITFADPASGIFDVVLLLLSGLVTGPTFMSISSLVLEL